MGSAQGVSTGTYRGVPPPGLGVFPRRAGKPGGFPPQRKLCFPLGKHSFPEKPENWFFEKNPVFRVNVGGTPHRGFFLGKLGGQGPCAPPACCCDDLILTL